jgi:predicted phage terminase large subunit-like protein
MGSKIWITDGECRSDPDYTVGVLMGKHPAAQMLYVIDVIRGRWTPAQVEQRIRSTAIFDGYETTIRIPQDRGGAGKFQAAYLVVQLQGYSVSTEREERSKEYRPDPFAALYEIFFVKLTQRVLLARSTAGQRIEVRILGAPNRQARRRADRPQSRRLNSRMR